jgi:hypothetical protein
LIAPPWSVEQQDACFVVRDHDGQPLAYVYFPTTGGGEARGGGRLGSLKGFGCAGKANHT